MTKELKISGARSLAKENTIKIVPSVFENDEKLYEDAKNLFNILMECIPVRTYKYLLKLLNDTEWKDAQEFIFIQAENDDQQIKQRIPISKPVWKK